MALTMWIGEVSQVLPLWLTVGTTVVVAMGAVCAFVSAAARVSAPPDERRLRGPDAKARIYQLSERAWRRRGERGGQLPEEC